jgi:PAS domain-containing protein
MLPLANVLEAMRAGCEALAHERQRYADLFGLSPSAYLITDARGNVLEANAAAARLLEREARFLRGKPLALLLKRLPLRSTSRPILDAQARTVGHCWLLR